MQLFIENVQRESATKVTGPPIHFAIGGASRIAAALFCVGWSAGFQWGEGVCLSGVRPWPFSKNRTGSHGSLFLNTLDWIQGLFYTKTGSVRDAFSHF